MRAAGVYLKGTDEFPALKIARTFARVCINKWILADPYSLISTLFIIHGMRNVERAMGSRRYMVGNPAACLHNAGYADLLKC